MSNLNYLAHKTAQMAEKTDPKVLARSIWFELQKKKKINQLDKFMKLVEQQYSSINSRKRIYVESIEPLSSEQLENIKEAVEKKLNIKIDIANQINKSLIGGIKVIYEDEIIDLSLRGKINNLRIKMVGEHE